MKTSISYRFANIASFAAEGVSGYQTPRERQIARDLRARPRAWARRWAHALLLRSFGLGREARLIESTVSLQRGATTWVVNPLGRRVTCESGTLWLCFDGEPQDIVLEPGETHLCAQRSALSVHALSPSVVRLA